MYQCWSIGSWKYKNSHVIFKWNCSQWKQENGVNFFGWFSTWSSREKNCLVIFWVLATLEASVLPMYEGNVVLNRSKFSGPACWRPFVTGFLHKVFIIFHVCQVLWMLLTNFLWRRTKLVNGFTKKSMTINWLAQFAFKSKAIFSLTLDSGYKEQSFYLNLWFYSGMARDDDTVGGNCCVMFKKQAQVFFWV